MNTLPHHVFQRQQAFIRQAGRQLTAFLSGKEQAAAGRDNGSFVRLCGNLAFEDRKSVTAPLLQTPARILLAGSKKPVLALWLPVADENDENREIEDAAWSALTDWCEKHPPEHRLMLLAGSCRARWAAAVFALAAYHAYQALPDKSKSVPVWGEFVRMLSAFFERQYFKAQENGAEAGDEYENFANLSCRYNNPQELINAAEACRPHLLPEKVRVFYGKMHEAAHGFADTRQLLTRYIVKKDEDALAALFRQGVDIEEAHAVLRGRFEQALYLHQIEEMADDFPNFNRYAPYGRECALMTEVICSLPRKDQAALWRFHPNAVLYAVPYLSQNESVTLLADVAATANIEIWLTAALYLQQNKALPANKTVRRAFKRINRRIHTEMAGQKGLLSAFYLHAKARKAFPQFKLVFEKQRFTRTCERTCPPRFTLCDTLFAYSEAAAARVRDGRVFTATLTPHLLCDLMRLCCTQNGTDGTKRHDWALYCEYDWVMLFDGASTEVQASKNGKSAAPRPDAALWLDVLDKLERDGSGMQAVWPDENAPIRRAVKNLREKLLQA